jgi:GGDEF domain-containing protein
LSAPNVDFPALWKKIEEILAAPSTDGGWFLNILPLVLSLTGLNWAFLTELLTGDADHYAILAECPQVPTLDTRQSFNAGLAGLVHAKLQPLALPNLNPNDDLSAIFHPGDPLKKASSFYGWPLIYKQVPWGSLILVGIKGQVISPDKLQFLESLTLRLSAQLQQEKLFGRIQELNCLDPQTGLPHRSHFLERLDRQIEITLVKKKALILAVMGVSGLGRHAVTQGQAATKSLLRSLSLLLLQNSEDSWELGHISYGIFAISVPDQDEPALDKAILMLKKRLIDIFGQSGFSYHEARVVCPEDGTKPEALLEAGLTSLAEAAG